MPCSASSRGSRGHDVLAGRRAQRGDRARGVDVPDDLPSGRGRQHPAGQPPDLGQPPADERRSERDVLVEGDGEPDPPGDVGLVRLQVADRCGVVGHRRQPERPQRRPVALGHGDDPDAARTVEPLAAVGVDGVRPPARRPRRRGRAPGRRRPTPGRRRRGPARPPRPPAGRAGDGTPRASGGRAPAGRRPSRLGQRVEVDGAVGGDRQGPDGQAPVRERVEVGTPLAGRDGHDGARVRAARRRAARRARPWRSRRRRRRRPACRAGAPTTARARSSCSSARPSAT